MVATETSSCHSHGCEQLGTSRDKPHKMPVGSEVMDMTEVICDNYHRHSLDALVCIGGDGTLTTAQQLYEAGLPVVGVPKTIDNDIAATDFTFGFDTAVQIVTDAIDRLTTTAEAHNRVILVEVMGRTKGWIATYGGLAGGAQAILIPEVPYDIEEVSALIRRRHRRGKNYSVVVVAEGIEPPQKVELQKDAFGFDRLGGVAYQLAPVIEQLTGYETRVTVLGHLQRGGTPTAFDRVLGTRFGVHAADLAVAGATKNSGQRCTAVKRLLVHEAILPGFTERFVERGLASWYGEPYHGRRTASGEIYDMHEMTAAHRTLDFTLAHAEAVDFLNLLKEIAGQLDLLRLGGTERGYPQHSQRQPQPQSSKMP